MSALRLRLLGGFEARTGAGAEIALPRRKVQALLAYLASPPGQVHPRDKLAALLWPDVSDHQARQSLRQVLATLRRVLPAEPPVLRTNEAAVALHPAAIDVDVVAFERAAAAGTPAALEEAGALYRGDLLAGLTVESAPFEEWLVAERERLREQALDAFAQLLGHQRRARANEPAVQTALRLLALDPLQEAVHRTLMRLYAAQGRPDAGLRQYRFCVDILRRELGAEPEA
jgi:DNA-binding SARP family transcriptional activator